MVSSNNEEGLERELLETCNALMGYVGCTLRRSAPVNHPTQFQVLRALCNRPHSLSELAELVSVRLPTMSRSVDAMERHNWIERFHVPDDRRTTYLRLSETGREALSETETMAEGRVAEVLSRVSDTSRLRVAIGELRDALRPYAGEVRENE